MKKKKILDRLKTIQYLSKSSTITMSIKIITTILIVGKNFFNNIFKSIVPVLK